MRVAMAARFYHSGSILPGDCILEGSEAHHLAHVRRLQAGDLVVLFNGDGSDYPAVVQSIGKRVVTLNVGLPIFVNRESGVRLHVGCAMPKSDRADFLIEKLTELGVTEFTPLLTARAIVQPKPAIVEKLQRAVIESSKQCARNVLMQIHPPRSLTQWLRQPGWPTTKWILHPGGEELAPAADAAEIVAAIGPEGGFTDEEVANAVDAGFVCQSLGPRILRVETAAIGLAAITSGRARPVPAAGHTASTAV